MGDRPIENHKQVCSRLAPAGWRYTGWDDGFYLFQTGDYRIGFKEMCATDEDLNKENLALMANLGMTRVEPVELMKEREGSNG